MSLDPFWYTYQKIVQIIKVYRSNFVVTQCMYVNSKFTMRNVHIIKSMCNLLIVIFYLLRIFILKTICSCKWWFHDRWKLWNRYVDNCIQIGTYKKIKPNLYKLKKVSQNLGDHNTTKFGLPVVSPLLFLWNDIC